MATVAVIGTGISGMATAYLLHQAGHSITVYEKEARPGGHTRTLNVEYDGQDIAVDTGFIVFNYQNYPHLSALFKWLDVDVQKSSMSLAVTHDNGRFEWGARSLNAVFGQRRNMFKPGFYKLIGEIWRFNHKAEEVAGRNPALTLQGLIDELKLSKEFARDYLLPMGGAIWSCSPKTMLEFPAQTFVQFFKNHGLLSFTDQHQWYTVKGGSQKYLEKLIAPFADRIRLNCGVTKVSRESDGVYVTDQTGETHVYERVVFACHADQALRMLQDPTPEEQATLGAFTYQRNVAYLHRDAAMMPKRKACWASWVYQSDSAVAKAGEESAIGVTYWMNLLQSIDEKYPLFVTLNPARTILQELVFNSHEFEHPVFTQAAIAAQKKLPALQGHKNSWYCGAYTRYGFHEDGLLSAVNVAESMGVSIPWA